MGLPPDSSSPVWADPPPNSAALPATGSPCGVPLEDPPPPAPGYPCPGYPAGQHQKWGSGYSGQYNTWSTPPQQTTVYLADMGGFMGAFSRVPFPGLKIKGPRVPPRPGQVVIGYEAMHAEAGLCTCDTLSPCGWFFVGLWMFVFPPLCWLPCVLPSMHEMVQHPVYGDPSQA